ncbi:MAG: peptide chain release factor 2 [Anaerolineaceae bacterium]|nr:MAG: peptide chain release factor 2 [Anaerolineaceae bacterium]
MSNHVNKLKQIQTQVDQLMQRLEIDAKAAEVSALEADAAKPDLWDDPDAAQKIMQRMSKLREFITPWQKLSAQVADALELAELEGDSLDSEMEQEVVAISEIVEKMSFQAMLSGEYDDGDAILAIHAGAGGTDSQDWAEMLERMYIRWAEQNGYKVEIIERSDGDEAGIKSVTMSIKGAYAYGYLRSEQGVHRLVRLSPFDSASRRHTSFTKIELWPDIQGEIDIEINEKDLRIDTYRASGAGGQHVQKNDTAVRMTHLPTGVVVQCQNQRSQGQNRDRALQILKARLLELERQKQEAQLAVLKGENVDAGWGNQIRSYVLHPYQMVKDHRTNYEVGNVNAVLDGRLNEFMETYLRGQVSTT